MSASEPRRVDTGDNVLIRSDSSRQQFEYFEIFVE
jgi:hypothetical protein